MSFDIFIHVKNVLGLPSLPPSPPFLPYLPLSPPSFTHLTLPISLLFSLQVPYICVFLVWFETQCFQVSLVGSPMVAQLILMTANYFKPWILWTGVLATILHQMCLSSCLIFWPMEVWRLGFISAIRLSSNSQASVILLPQPPQELRLKGHAVRPRLKKELFSQFVCFFVLIPSFSNIYIWPVTWFLLFRPWFTLFIYKLKI